MKSPADLKKLHDIWVRFSGKHGDIASFGKSLYPDAVQNGSTYALYVKTPDNRTFDYNLTLDAEDVAMILEVMSIMGKK